MLTTLCHRQPTYFGTHLPELKNILNGRGNMVYVPRDVNCLVRDLPHVLKAAEMLTLCLTLSEKDDHYVHNVKCSSQWRMSGARDQRSDCLPASCGR